MNVAKRHCTQARMGSGYLFCGYGVANLLIALYVFSCIPETMGKTLEQIQNGSGTR